MKHQQELNELYKSLAKIKARIIEINKENGISVSGKLESQSKAKFLAKMEMDAQKENRIKEIVTAIDSGIPTLEVAKNHGIGYGRTRQLYKAFKSKQKFESGLGIEPTSPIDAADSVNRLGLCVRAANCLRNADISTIAQLLAKTKKELLEYRNFGRQSMFEINHALKRAGFCELT